MAYKIDVELIGSYIEYLKKFKKELERNLLDFEKELKQAKDYWDDSNYTLTIETKNAVALEQKKLIDSIDKSLKNLKIMHEEYERYLKKRK